MRNKFKQYIYISSASIYNNIQSFPIKETETTGENPIWGEYAKNKFLSEQKILEYSSECNYTIFRPFYIYGIGNNLDRESYIFSRIKNNLPIFLPNKVEEIVKFGYIDDLVKARDWFPFRDTHLFGSIDKIKSVGFKNKYDLLNGLNKTYKYLEENNLLHYPQLHKIEKV